MLRVERAKFLTGTGFGWFVPVTAEFVESSFARCSHVPDKEVMT